MATPTNRKHTCEGDFTDPIRCRICGAWLNLDGSPRGSLEDELMTALMRPVTCSHAFPGLPPAGWRCDGTCEPLGRPDHPVHQPVTSSGDTEPAAVCDELAPSKLVRCDQHRGHDGWHKGHSRRYGAVGWAPASSGQTEHGIDTGALRRGSCGALNDLERALCDALDRQREETARLRAESDAHYEDALTHQGRARRAEFKARDARARLDEIRALWDFRINRGQAFLASTDDVPLLRAILDRPEEGDQAQQTP